MTLFLCSTTSQADQTRDPVALCIVGNHVCALSAHLTSLCLNILPLVNSTGLLSTLTGEMSENKRKDVAPGNGLTRAAIIEMMTKNFERLPDIEKKLFLYGPVYLGGNAALAGLISNSLYRRALNVRQAAISSSLPMAVLPFITTFALYNATVSSPLMSADLNCPSCVMMRGALIGVVGGGIYPILLALPVNVGLATRYSTAPLPEKGSQMRFWVDITKPILRRMRAVLVLQVFFGTYLSSRHFQTYTQLVEMTFASHREELKD